MKFFNFFKFQISFRKELSLFLTQSNSKAGFTLIEIAVAMVVIIILSVMVLANYERGEYQLTLQRTVHKLAQDLRKVEEMAMSAKEFEESIPLGGYGIYFDSSSASTSYILFVDSDGNNEYDAPTEKIEEIELEEGVRIFSLSPADPLTINFRPPDPIVMINKATDISATIFLAGKTQLGKVYVNSIGLIEIEIQ